MASTTHVTTTALAVLTLAAAAPPAAAENRGITGTLAVTSASISGRGAELVSNVKRASTKRPVIVHADDGWLVHYALVVPRALPSAEITIRVSDTTRAKQQLCSRHRVIYSDAEVTRGKFTLTDAQVLSSNARLMIEIESDGQPIARQTFFIKGKPAAKAISFSEAEANGGDDEDEDARPNICR